MSEILSYSIYNNERLAVRGNRDRYQDILKKYGARWNPRMRGGEGWLVPIIHKKSIDTLISSLVPVNNTVTQPSIEKKIQASTDDVVMTPNNVRKEKKKYHRVRRAAPQ